MQAVQMQTLDFVFTTALFGVAVWFAVSFGLPTVQSVGIRPVTQGFDLVRPFLPQSVGDWCAATGKSFIDAVERFDKKGTELMHRALRAAVMWFVGRVVSTALALWLGWHIYSLVQSAQQQLDAAVIAATKAVIDERLGASSERSAQDLTWELCVEAVVGNELTSKVNAVFEGMPDGAKGIGKTMLLMAAGPKPAAAVERDVRKAAKRCEPLLSGASAKHE